MNTFATYLHELRKSRGMTQQELADRLDLTGKAVSKWEKGEAFPETGQLVPLADIFGVSVDELLHGRTSEKTVKRAEEKNRPTVFYIGQSAAALSALFTLVFVFFMGCNAFTDGGVPATNLFYYFKDVYSDLHATQAALGDYYIHRSSLVDVPLYAAAASGTVCSVCILVLTTLFALITLARYLKVMMNLSEKSLTRPVTGCYAVYATGCALLLALQNVRLTNLEHATGTTLNGETIAGLVLGGTFLAVYLICGFFVQKPNRIQAVSACFSVCSAILLVIALGFLASPMLETTDYLLKESAAYSPFSFLRFYGTYPFENFDFSEVFLFGKLSDEPYDSLEILLCSIPVYLLLFASAAYRIAVYLGGLPCRSRCPFAAEICGLLLLAPFVLFTVLPLAVMSAYMRRLYFCDGLIVSCAILGAQFLVSAAHCIVKYRNMKKQLAKENVA